MYDAIVVIIILKCIDMPLTLVLLLMLVLLIIMTMLKLMIIRKRKRRTITMIYKYNLYLFLILDFRSCDNTKVQCYTRVHKRTEYYLIRVMRKWVLFDICSSRPINANETTRPCVTAQAALKQRWPHIA